MVADKSKKPKVDDRDEGSDPMDEHLVLSVEKLQEIQDELEKINGEASEKVLAIEEKYNEKRKPIYDKRQEILNTIPDFWLTAFMNHPAIGHMFTREDQKIFKYMTSLYVEDFKDVKSGYSITFNFSSNPYFENTKLTKTIKFLDERTKITGTSIKWKEGMGIPNGAENEKEGNKRSASDESFFSWFSDVEDKETVDENDIDIEDEIAEIIKDDLWPNPFNYFSNDPDEYRSDGEDDEEADGDEDAEDDDDDDNDDDNDDYNDDDDDDEDGAN